MQVISISKSQYTPYFQGGIGIFDSNAQQMIMKNCNNKQIEELKEILRKQQNDKVFCFIYTDKNKKHLEARFQCTHFINNFKEFYKQIPFFESTFGFIKRMSKRMNKYKKILQDAGDK